MVRRLLCAALALLFAHSAAAQTVQDGFVVPPDVPLYEEVPVVYASGSTASVLGDGSDARGGTMPVLAIELADIPTDPAVKEDWLEGSPSYETVLDPPNEETKVRFLVDFSHASGNDPIRNWGDPGGSHFHLFFGVATTNAYSTFASLRNQANDASTADPPRSASSFGGGPNNASAYWVPAPLIPDAFGDDKTYALPMDRIVVYYEANPADKALHASELPLGLRYVFGTDMDDPYDTEFKAEIAAANAQPGTAGRYSYLNNGFLGFECWDNPPGGSSIPATVEATSGGASLGTQTSTGTDPWAGACTAGKYLVARIEAPECFDGSNLWAPGGYRNFRQRVQDNFRNDAWEGCPEGWFILPRLHLTVWFEHQGWDDYSRWVWSCDVMANAAAKAIDPEAPDLRPGQCFHSDWMGAWDGELLDGWLDGAFGVFGNETLLRMDNSTISATQRLLTGSTPDGTRGGTQVHGGDTKWDTLAPENMIEVPDTYGPVTVPIHSHDGSWLELRYRLPANDNEHRDVREAA